MSAIADADEAAVYADALECSPRRLQTGIFETSDEAKVRVRDAGYRLFRWLDYDGPPRPGEGAVVKQIISMAGGEIIDPNSRFVASSCLEKILSCLGIAAVSEASIYEGVLLAVERFRSEPFQAISFGRGIEFIVQGRLATVSQVYDNNGELPSISSTYRCTVSRERLRSWADALYGALRLLAVQLAVEDAKGQVAENGGLVLPSAISEIRSTLREHMPVIRDQGTTPSTTMGFGQGEQWVIKGPPSPSFSTGGGNLLPPDSLAEWAAFESNTPDPKDDLP